jgi:hypothetical protein
MNTADPVLEALENPVDAPFLAEAGDPGPMMGDDDNGSRHARPPFPLDGPVKCLGIQSDMGGAIKCYYLDCLGQIVGLDANTKHGKNALIALYGQQSGFLEASWPQWSKPKKEYDKSAKCWVEVEKARIIGFDQAEASRSHIEECSRKGIFDPSGKLRGRGAHRSDKGHLVLHLGDALLLPRERASGAASGYEYKDPGAHGGYVYPAFAPSMRPHHEEAGIDAGQRILMQLQTWSYKRPLLDPMLLLGALVASQLGGFLAWRPVMWIVGPRGTGKSTLDGEPSANEGFIGHLLGPGRMNTANASEAAIRQTLKNSTVPVFIDELEPDAPKEKIDALIALARVAAGGAKGHRGGQDQQAHEFTLRSPFWFSSILQPPLQAQDRSRIVTVELKKLRGDLKKPDFFKLNAALLGQKLLRRVVDQASRLDATIALYAEALQKRGLDARGQNVYGTLLACADIALYDELPDDELVNEWALRCDPASLTEIGDAASEERSCLEHLLTSPVQARGGDERVTLGSWIGNGISEVMDGESDNTWLRRIQQLGLKLVNVKLNGMVTGPDGEQAPRWGAQNYVPGQPGYLAIAWKHRGLDPLYQETKWRGGVWKQALGRTEIEFSQSEGAEAVKGMIGAIDGVKVKFDRISANAVLVPLCAVIDAEELPKQCMPEAVAAWIAKQIEGAA